MEGFDSYKLLESTRKLVSKSQKFQRRHLESIVKKARSESRKNKSEKTDD